MLAEVQCECSSAPAVSAARLPGKAVAYNPVLSPPGVLGTWAGEFRSLCRCWDGPAGARAGERTPHTLFYMVLLCGHLCFSTELLGGKCSLGFLVDKILTEQLEDWRQENRVLSLHTHMQL